MKGETLVLWSDLCVLFPSLSTSLSRSFSQERYITVAPYSFGNIARLTTGCNNFPYLAADVYAAATSKRARVAAWRCISALLSSIATLTLTLTLDYDRDQVAAVATDVRHTRGFASRANGRINLTSRLDTCVIASRDRVTAKLRLWLRVWLDATLENCNCNRVEFRIGRDLIFIIKEGKGGRRWRKRWIIIYIYLYKF